jgi:hypothetical protein
VFFFVEPPNAAGEKEMVILSLSFYIQSVRSPNDVERMNEEGINQSFVIHRDSLSSIMKPHALISKKILLACCCIV